MKRNKFEGLRSLGGGFPIRPFSVRGHEKPRGTAHWVISWDWPAWVGAGVSRRTGSPRQGALEGEGRPRSGDHGRILHRGADMTRGVRLPASYPGRQDEGRPCYLGSAWGSGETRVPPRGALRSEEHTSE